MMTTMIVMATPTVSGIPRSFDAMAGVIHMLIVWLI
jgi:hypothetical protein